METTCRIKQDLRVFWEAADPSLVLIMLDVEHAAIPFIQELALPLAVLTPPSTIVTASRAIVLNGKLKLWADLPRDTRSSLYCLQSLGSRVLGVGSGLEPDRS